MDVLDVGVRKWYSIRCNFAIGSEICGRCGYRCACRKKTAMENAEINHVADRFTAIAGNLTEQINGKYHIVLANIVADVIMMLTEDIEQYLYPDSIYIMSGIIDTREQDVLDAISEKFEIIERKEEKRVGSIGCSPETVGGFGHDIIRKRNRTCSRHGYY